MRIHKYPSGRMPGPGACVLALLILAAASPAAAASDEDVKGWVVAVDLALTQPSGLDQEYAFQFDTTSVPQTGIRHIMKNDADATFRFTAGYNFGLAMGGLQVSFWSFDHDDKQSDSLSGQVFPSIFGYGLYTQSYPFVEAYNAPGVGTFATSSVKASTVDLEYTRALDVGENFTFRWLAGLRTADFEEGRTVELQGAYAGKPMTIQQNGHMDSKARGIKVGGRGIYGFTKHQSLEGGLAFSLLQGDSKGDSSQTFRVFDAADLTAPPTVYSEAQRAEDKSGQGQILDLDLKYVWTADALSVYLGYSYSAWEGLVRDPNLPRTTYFSVTGAGGRDTVIFSGFDVGIIYRFGARRLAAP